MLFNNLITDISLVFLHFKTSKQYLYNYVGHMYFVQAEQKCLQRKFIWIFYLRLFCAVSSRRNTEYIEVLTLSGWLTRWLLCNYLKCCGITLAFSVFRWLLKDMTEMREAVTLLLIHWIWLVLSTGKSMGKGQSKSYDFSK